MEERKQKELMENSEVSKLLLQILLEQGKIRMHKETTLRVILFLIMCDTIQK